MPTKRETKTRATNRERWLTALLSFLYSFFLVYGIYFKIKGSEPAPALVLVALIAIMTFVIYVALKKFWSVLDSHKTRNCLEYNKKTLIISSSVILICWAVVFLASWPGYYAYDTNYTTDYIQNGTLNTQQPAFFVILVGNILKLGMNIFGNFNGAVAFYTVIQTLICFAFVVHLLKILMEMNVSKVLFILSVVFYAICPSITLYVLCAVKDTLFSLCLIAFSLNCHFLVKENDKKKTTFRISMCVLLTFLIIALRDNGMYALIPSVVLLALFLKKSGRAKNTILFTCSACTVGILLGLVWNGPIVMNCFSTTASNPIRQMISIPAAQLSNAAATDPDFDTSKLEELGVDKDTLVILYKNHPDNSDAFRVQFWDAIDAGKFSTFLQIWAEEFVSHPRAYLEAFLDLTECAWSPFDYVHCYNFEGNTYFEGTDSSVFMALNEAPAQTDSKLPWLYSAIWSYSRDNPFCAYPLFAWTSSVACFVWLFLLVLFRMLIKRKRAGLMFCIPLLFVALTCLLGPTVLIRYYWYLFLSAPLLINLLVPTRKQPKTSSA